MFFALIETESNFCILQNVVQVKLFKKQEKADFEQAFASIVSTVVMEDCSSSPIGIEKILNVPYTKI